MNNAKNDTNLTKIEEDPMVASSQQKDMSTTIDLDDLNPYILERIISKADKMDMPLDEFVLDLIETSQKKEKIGRKAAARIWVLLQQDYNEIMINSSPEQREQLENLERKAKTLWLN